MKLKLSLLITTISIVANSQFAHAQPQCNPPKSIHPTNINNIINSGSGRIPEFPSGRVLSTIGTNSIYLPTNDGSNAFTISTDGRGQGSAIPGLPNYPFYSSEYFTDSSRIRLTKGTTNTYFAANVNDLTRRQTVYVLDVPSSAYTYSVGDLFSEGTMSAPDYVEVVEITGYDALNNPVYPIFFDPRNGAQVTGVNNNRVRDGVPDTNQANIKYYFGTPVKRIVNKQIGTQDYVLYSIYFCLPNVSGTIWQDANGDVLKQTTEPFLGNSTDPLFVYLIDNLGKVAYRTRLTNAGSYKFNEVHPRVEYTILLSTDSVAIGASQPAISLPSDYVHTGERFGNNNQSGTGTEDRYTTPGSIKVSSNGNHITNVDFGIQRPPTAEEKNFVINTTEFNGTLPIGFNSVAGYHSLPMTSTALIGYATGGSLSGSDPEDCPTMSSCNSADGSIFTIEAINQNTKLYYDFGVGPVEIDLTNGAVTIDNFDATKMVIYAQDGSGSVGNAIGFTYTMTDKAGFQSTPVNYTILVSSPLSVELITFRAMIKDGVVLLDWVTASENNNFGFEIQRSTDSRTWAHIGFVDSKAEFGNSSCIEYTFVDNTYKDGINHYRLKQLDYDGNFQYSDHRTIKVAPQNSIEVFPNPANDILTVMGLGKGVTIINIYDMIGNKIATEKTSERQHTISVNEYTKGVYQIQLIQSDGKTFIKKFLKIK